jgi:DNA modification methylase
VRSALRLGTTSCKWDTIIPFEPLWEQYNRIIKDNGAIVLFGSEPFSTELRHSNLKRYKYDWIWNKNLPTGFALAKRQPMKSHENILVFYKSQPIYNKQPTKSKIKDRKLGGSNGMRAEAKQGGVYGNLKTKQEEIILKENVSPRSVLEIDCVPRSKGTLHPTQKPVDLCEYLIKTYTNEGETVLDNCAGSGTTGIACQNTGRNYILIEKEQKYIDIIKTRLEDNAMRMQQNTLF